MGCITFTGWRQLLPFLVNLHRLLPFSTFLANVHQVDGTCFSFLFLAGRGDPVNFYPLRQLSHFFSQGGEFLPKEERAKFNEDVTFEDLSGCESYHHSKVDRFVPGSHDVNLRIVRLPEMYPGSWMKATFEEISGCEGLFGLTNVSHKTHD